MAPTLTSNYFLLTTTPRSRTTRKSRRPIVLAKKGGSFSPFGKSVDDASPEEGQQNSSPFKFDFGKLPDVKSLVPVVPNPSSGLNFGNLRRKDPGTVFVAGATGQAGIRIAQTLLRQGFSVRAGVPDLAAAQELALLAAQYKIISNDESRRLNAVNSSFDDAESIAKAIGNASKVVVTIGPGENGPSAEVTTNDALQVMQAAELAKVSHVAIVYDGSLANASTYNVLDGITSFFNNLFSKSQPLTISELLQNVVKTDISYTVIKTKLTEDFSPESSYNLVVSAEGNGAAAAAYDYKVAISKIASLVADVFSNTVVAENKVVEVYTNPSAPSKAINELFSAIPEDDRRKVYAEAFAKEKAEEEARKASEQARDAAKKLEEGAKKQEQEEARAATLAAEARKKAEAQKKAEAAGSPVESLFDKAKGITSGISWENLSSQLKSAVQKPEEEPKVQLATVSGQARARSLPSLKAVVKNSPRKSPPSKAKEIPKPKAKETEQKTETRKVFGGLFQQETIYVDDD